MEAGAGPIGELNIRERARAAVRAGKLPRRKPDRMWGGRGAGADCTICRLPVKPDELEFEIEFDQDEDAPGPVTHHIHLPCFAAWEFERDSLAAGAPPHLDAQAR